METSPSNLFYIIEESETAGTPPVKAGGQIQATGFLPGKLTRHYTDHAKAFSVGITPEQYEQRARNFFGKEVSKNIKWFRDIDGYLYKYNRKRNEFGICSPDGFIITYFRPEENIKYWYGQVQKYGI
jgi:pyocin large subunit-like protein